MKGRADIDLVIMLNEYNNVDGLMREMNEVLRQLRSHLEKIDVKHQKTTRYSVQIQITCRAGHTHDVDILPTVDFLAQGRKFLTVIELDKDRQTDTTDGGRERGYEVHLLIFFYITGYTLDDIFKKMRTASPTNIHEYSVSLAPVQLEIISPLPTKVKSLIKLVKYWKNEKLKVKYHFQLYVRMLKLTIFKCKL